jgi:hypothetical protein
MDRRVGEIGQSAGVVGIAVRQDNVRDVHRPEPQPLDLPRRCKPLVELKSRDLDELLPDPLQRLRHVEQADASIKEREPTTVFEQQTVASRAWV